MDKREKQLLVREAVSLCFTTRKQAELEDNTSSKTLQQAIKGKENDQND